MHIPDGRLCPLTLCAGWAIATPLVILAWRRTRSTLSGDRSGLFVGITTLIFASQMLNVPIADGTSGHVVGAAAAAIVLGPWAAVLALSMVLSVQALLFGDGGMLALGCNIAVMGVVATAAAQAVLVGGRAAQGRMGGMLVSAAAAWFSAMAAAAACAVALASSGWPISTVLPAMLDVHMGAGLIEALATVVVVQAVQVTRPVHPVLAR